MHFLCSSWLLSPFSFSASFCLFLFPDRLSESCSCFFLSSSQPFFALLAAARASIFLSLSQCLSFTCLQPIFSSFNIPLCLSFFFSRSSSFWDTNNLYLVSYWKDFLLNSSLWKWFTLKCWFSFHFRMNCSDEKERRKEDERETESRRL